MTTTHAPARPVVAAPTLLGVDHVELWVGNARQAAAFFAGVLGFEPAAYAGPETGVTDRASHVLVQGGIRVVVTAALSPDSPVAAHVRTHGDGVRAVSFTVADAVDAYDAAVARGARTVERPRVEHDEHGTLTRATVAAYGETVHTFVGRSSYGGPFAPGYQPTDLPRPAGPDVGLSALDHVVANVEEGALDRWVSWYEDVFDLEQLLHFDRDQISTEFSALRSTVVWNGDGVVLPVNEPAPGRRTSQIQEYLDSYGGPGVQHLALATDDIITTVSALRQRGLRFLGVPASYYDEARERMAGVELPWEELAGLGILVDRDRLGHLLQVFTEPIGDRPTLFLEIIQRAGARGFGEGNFKALFEAIEREQDRRGNL